MGKEHKGQFLAEANPIQPHKKSGPARFLAAFAGLLIGAFCLWLVLRGLNMSDMRTTLMNSNAYLLLLGVAAYWIAMILRIIRWHRLLVVAVPIDLHKLIEPALIGYSASIVMPARLGEPLRAEYAQRRCNTDRFSAFGSIITERLIDVVLVVVMFLVGLAIAVPAAKDGKFSQLFIVIVIAMGITSATICILLALKFRRHTGITPPHWLEGPIHRLLLGVETLNHRNLPAIAALSMLVWAFEIAALWAVCRSFGPSLDIAQLFLLTGVATFSSLIPGAPGHVGTLQLVYGVGMSAMNLETEYGVLAATIVQALFYGSLVLVTAIFVIIQRTRTSTQSVAKL